MTEYSAPVGAPIWFDLMSSDPAKAAEFYHAIFGWELAEPARPEFGGYQNFTKNGRRIAGLVPPMGEEAGPSDIWSVYLHTADSEATRKAVETAGGSIMVPPMPVGDLGSMMVAVDPAGAVIGFWQPGSHVGFTQWGEHGAPYWFECHSRDYEKSCAFYPAVIGARLEEVGTGGDPEAVGPDRYSSVFVGESAYSGIMDAASLYPPEVPSFWQVYITVDDVAATVQQARELGAEILMPGEDTPYGTLAALRDPLGALFCLGHPPAGR
ncbi:VOC family protein [Mycobacterium sp. ACS4331]|uniref:VOC family protein n=1 Tax=Mycobacterium sp. ACS4331 TaxID=1834121 RepID=UPI000801B44A|nr:VOC family protein [Mycobacterium sp. ACS4331]OBF15744.1 glyoxalase [Mycobacterium sp. ACS4331]